MPKEDKLINEYMESLSLANFVVFLIILTCYASCDTLCQDACSRYSDLKKFLIRFKYLLTTGMASAQAASIDAPRCTYKDKNRMVEWWIQYG